MVLAAIRTEIKPHGFCDHDVMNLVTFMYNTMAVRHCYDSFEKILILVNFQNLENSLEASFQVHCAPFFRRSRDLGGLCTSV